MAFLDTPERPEPRVSPQLLVGAASPLWGYFGAAAASGVAFWWMTRWAQPVNLEALFDAATRAMKPAEAAPLALEALVEPVEAAPVELPEPVVEAAPASEPVVEAGPVVEAAPVQVMEAEPVVETAPEAAPAAEPVLEAAPAPKARPKKAAPIADEA